jgi:hypothetical protein
MALHNNAKHAMLDHLATLATRLSLHSGDPGASGTANEITGGSPAYARQAIAWNAAAAGSLDSSNVPEFDVPGGDTPVSHWGLWNTAGTVFYGSGAFPDTETFAGQGKYQVTDFDIALT